MRKWAALLLLIAGLIVEFLGFICDKSGFFNFILPVIARQYTQGMEGVRHLESNQSLRPGAPGFEPVERVLLQIVEQQNPNQPIEGISVVEFSLKGGAGIAFGALGIRPTRPLVVTISNGQELPWDLERLIRRLNDIRDDRLTKASILIFLLGIMLQIIGFLKSEWRTADPRLIRA